MADTNHKRLRYLYALELIVFGLPTLGVLAQYFLTLAFFSYGGLIVTLYGMATSSDHANTEHLVFALLFSGLVTAAVVALWHFATLSVAYLSAENIRAKKPRRKFRIGLWCSVVPLLFTIAAALREYGVGGSHFIELIYLSGLPLLVPVVHLALASSSRQRGAESSPARA